MSSAPGVNLHLFKKNSANFNYVEIILFQVRSYSVQIFPKLMSTDLSYNKPRKRKVDIDGRQQCNDFVYYNLWS